jgi:hypothetical protein
MDPLPPPLAFFLLLFSGWVNRQQQAVIDYLFGEPHLRAAVRSFMHHYHEERPHQGLDNELITPKTTVIGAGPIKCRERLGGLLKFYYREAA